MGEYQSDECLLGNHDACFMCNCNCHVTIKETSPKILRLSGSCGSGNHVACIPDKWGIMCGCSCHTSTAETELEVEGEFLEDVEFTPSPQLFPEVSRRDFFIGMAMSGLCAREVGHQFIIDQAIRIGETMMERLNGEQNEESESKENL